MVDKIAAGRAAEKLLRELEPYIELLREDMFKEWKSMVMREDREALYAEQRALERLQFKFERIIKKGKQAEEEAKQ